MFIFLKPFLSIQQIKHLFREKKLRILATYNKVTKLYGFFFQLLCGVIFRVGKNSERFLHFIL